MGACQNKINEQELFSIMKENPKMMLEVLQQVQSYQQEQYLQSKWQQETSQTKKISYNNVPMLGNADAEHTVMVYYSYLCGYCTGVQDLITEIMTYNYSDTKVFFKIVGEDANSMKTAAIFNYLAKTDIHKALAFNNEIFKHQKEYFKDPGRVVNKAIKTLGLPSDIEEKSMTNEFMEYHKASVQEYKDNNCEGTPTFIINDKYSIAGLVSTDIFFKAFYR